MDEQMIGKLLYGVLALGILVRLYTWILPNWRGYRNRKQPTVTVRATVVGKAEGADYAIYAGSAARFSGQVYCIVFRTAEGLEVTLTVPRDDYYNFREGTAGILTYQGTKCEKFTPDRCA